MAPAFRLLLLPLLGLPAASCEYAGLLRPSVLSQLDPPTVRLLNELPEVDRPNEATIARLFATGGLARAEPGADGVLRAAIDVPPGQMIWKAGDRRHAARRQPRAHLLEPRRRAAHGLPAQRRRAAARRAAAAAGRAGAPPPRRAGALSSRPSGVGWRTVGSR